MSKNPGSISEVKGLQNYTPSANPYILSNVGAPTQYNSATVPVTYNGFKWSFSSPVTWGRFVSGEPYIILPPAGVMVTGVSYENTPGVYENCPILKTGYTNEAGQLNNVGITMWVNGSMKNPVPWYHIELLNWSLATIGTTIQKWSYDERYSNNINLIKGWTVIKDIDESKFPMSEFLRFPVGLSAGDVLVTTKSNFNANWQQSNRPQGVARFVAFTDPWMSRLGIEKYGILTSIPQGKGPTYADCYRPPVMWNGSSFSDRPIFYRRDMVKNTEDYLLSMPDKNVYGEDINLNSISIQQEFNNWNDKITNYWKSSVMPYHSHHHRQGAVGAYDVYNSTPNETKYGYHGYSCKIIDQTAQSIFVPWVSRTNRQKALDKFTQYGIDSWGMINAGGAAAGNGGHNQGIFVPSLAFLGWVYDRNDIKQWHNNKQLLDKLKSTQIHQTTGASIPGISGGRWAIGQIQVPSDFYVKSLVSQDYNQRVKLFGSAITNKQGFTHATLTNSDINLYHGLTYPSVASGATGEGWGYKLTGITCAFAYSVPSLELTGQIVSGNFGVIVAHRDFVGRLNGLGPKSNKGGPAELPLKLNSNGYLMKKGFHSEDDVTDYWGFTSQTLVGSKIKITSGPGAGNTAYEILDVKNTFVDRGSLQAGDEEIEQTVTNTNLQKLQYASFILDRDFDDNVVPTSESTFKIYPAENNYSGWGFYANPWLQGYTYNMNLTTIYNQHNYNDIADENIMKFAAMYNWLGITHEQYMVDYIKDLYWNTAIPSYIRRRKILGGPYLGSIYDSSNIVGGNVIVQMLGITGATFLPRSINLNDLAGINDTVPALDLNGITLEFIPEPITNYTVINGSGISYSGYGKIFNTPQTPFKIDAIIDDKIFINPSFSSLYTLISRFKAKNGPFLSDDLITETQETDNQYKDRYAIYNFLSKRDFTNVNNVVSSAEYLRNIPSLQTLNQTNTKLNLTFISNQYGVAGAAGILPNNGETNLLTTSYGMRAITRNGNLLTIVMDMETVDGTIELNDIWYCVANPTIAPGITAMADEYIISNWKKAENVFGYFAGTNIGFYTNDLPASGSLIPNYNPSTTDDKLIFFKYLTKLNIADTQNMISVVPAPTGITQSQWSNINSINYAGWTFSDAYKIHKIDSIITNNTPGNAGYFRYNFINSTANDYRRYAYNTFRLWYNNFIDMETIRGIPTFSIRQEVDTNVFEQMDMSVEKLTLNETILTNQFYNPKGRNILNSGVIGSDYEHNGFYNTYIHGLTFNLLLPPTPHTLLWCSGATI